MVQWASRAHTDITYIYMCTHTHLKTICIYMQSSCNILYNVYVYIYICVCVTSLNAGAWWWLVAWVGKWVNMGEFRLVGMRCLNYLFHQPDLIWPRFSATQESPFCFLHSPAFTLQLVTYNQFFVVTFPCFRRSRYVLSLLVTSCKALCWWPHVVIGRAHD